MPILQESLRRWGRLGDRWGSIWAVEMLALSALRLGRHEHAARLLGATTRMQASTGVAISGLGPFAVAHTQAKARAREVLGDKRYEAAHHAGAALTFEDTVRFALQDEDNATPPTPVKAADLLSARELEVAALVAGGLSNAEVAAALVISRHTCERARAQYPAQARLRQPHRDRPLVPATPQYVDTYVVLYVIPVMAPRRRIGKLIQRLVSRRELTNRLNSAGTRGSGRPG